MPATTTPNLEADTRFPPHDFSITPGPASDPTVELVLGDITREATDAIVNPVGPGLVDLAIRRAAGPELLETFHWRVDELPDAKLRPGQVIATPGFRLPAAHVIPIAGRLSSRTIPAGARQGLVACHIESLRLARAAGWISITFPRHRHGRLPLPGRRSRRGRRRDGRHRASPPRQPKPGAVRVREPRDAAAVYRRRGRSHRPRLPAGGAWRRLFLSPLLDLEGDVAGVFGRGVARSR